MSFIRVCPHCTEKVLFRDDKTCPNCNSHFNAPLTQSIEERISQKERQKNYDLSSQVSPKYFKKLLPMVWISMGLVFLIVFAELLSIDNDVLLDLEEEFRGFTFEMAFHTFLTFSVIPAVQAFAVLLQFLTFKYRLKIESLWVKRHFSISHYSSFIFTILLLIMALSIYLFPDIIADVLTILMRVVVGYLAIQIVMMMAVSVSLLSRLSKKSILKGNNSPI